MSPALLTLTCLLLLAHVFVNLYVCAMCLGGIFFEQILGSGFIALVILQITNFLATIPSLLLVDSFGRRGLLLWGASCMALAHCVAAVAYTVGCIPECSNAAAIIYVIAGM